MIKYIRTPIGVSLSVALLSACGGGSGGADASFADRQSEFDTLAAELDALPFTNASTLPAIGTATYNGFLGVGTGDAVIGGQMQLNANFESNSIDGDVRNIIDNQNNEYGGTLLITNGSINRAADVETEYSFGADLGGNLTQGGDTFSVDATMDGDFVGGDYVGVRGDVTGTVAAPEGISIIGGEFYGKR